MKTNVLISMFLLAPPVAQGFLGGKPKSMVQKDLRLGKLRRLSKPNAENGCSPAEATEPKEDRRWNFNEDGSSPYGFDLNAEIWNGRVAQVCFAWVFIQEVIQGRGIIIGIMEGDVPSRSSLFVFAFGMVALSTYLHNMFVIEDERTRKQKREERERIEAAENKRLRAETEKERKQAEEEKAKRLAEAKANYASVSRRAQRLQKSPSKPTMNMDPTRFSRPLPAKSIANAELVRDSTPLSSPSKPRGDVEATRLSKASLSKPKAPVDTMKHSKPLPPRSTVSDHSDSTRMSRPVPSIISGSMDPTRFSRPIPRVVKVENEPHSVDHAPRPSQPTPVTSNAAGRTHSTSRLPAISQPLSKDVEAQMEVEPTHNSNNPTVGSEMSSLAHTSTSTVAVKSTKEADSHKDPVSHSHGHTFSPVAVNGLISAVPNGSTSPVPNGSSSETLESILPNASSSSAVTRPSAKSPPSAPLPNVNGYTASDQSPTSLKTNNPAVARTASRPLDSITRSKTEKPTSPKQTKTTQPRRRTTPVTMRPTPAPVPNLLVGEHNPAVKSKREALPPPGGYANPDNYEPEPELRDAISNALSKTLPGAEMYILNALPPEDDFDGEEMEQDGEALPPYQASPYSIPNPAKKGNYLDKLSP